MSGINILIQTTIRSNGLLTKAERNAKSINSRNHGSIFGDGIYAANYPTSFARYGEQGLLVARLIGKLVRVPKSLSCLTSSNFLDIANSSNTIVGDKTISLSHRWCTVTWIPRSLLLYQLQ